MASRNLTRLFEEFRSRAKSDRPGASDHKFDYTEPSDGRKSLLAGGPSHMSEAVVALDIAGPPPPWIDLVDSVNENCAKIEQHIKNLDVLHTQRLNITFSDSESEKDQEIDFEQHEVIRLLKNCEHLLKRVATVGTDTGVLSGEERAVRLNVIRSVGARMQALSKRFRNQQQTYLKKSKGQEVFSAGVSGDARGREMDLDEALEQGLSEQQMRQLEDLERTADEREKAIIHLAQNINDLTMMFREMNCLVIEQGTMLDRIDHHVENTLASIKSGTKEMIKADEYSRKSAMRSLKCICFLIFVVIVLSAILVIKKQN